MVEYHGIKIRQIIIKKKTHTHLLFLWMNPNHKPVSFQESYFIDMYVNNINIETNIRSYTKRTWKAAYHNPGTITN